MKGYVKWNLCLKRFQPSEGMEQGTARLLATETSENFS